MIETETQVGGTKVLLAIVGYKYKQRAWYQGGRKEVEAVRHLHHAQIDSRVIQDAQCFSGRHSFVGMHGPRRQYLSHPAVPTSTSLVPSLSALPRPTH